MAVSARAVFLSYASGDGDAAAKICEALRSAGIEVWFDQSELRGGDAWDTAIRNQIRTCALFIPVISGSTRARGEGYFRLEWKLAIDRSHLMAGDVPFLVPVSIDDIGDSDARVPDRFRELQWTRLPGGQTPPQFVARIQSLLEQLGTVPTDPVAPIAAQKPNLATALVARRAGWQWLVAMAAVVIIGVGFWVFHRFGAAVSPESNFAYLDTAIPEKSIAVLPFENMSTDKDQEYFSDGLAEEVIDQLTKIPDLRVPARTSSFSFKGKADDIAVIARKLRVANILEGSVRKSGDRLRVTANLIRANNGYHLWSETYDRELKDVFKVQDDIASAVVAVLKVKLAARSSGSQTTNPDAYNQYLLGRELDRVSNAQAKKRALAAFIQAIALDPGYADAYAAAGDTQFWVADRTADAPGYAQAFAYVQKAVDLAPDAAEGYIVRGFLKVSLKWDWTGGRGDYQKALELDPGSARARSRLGNLLHNLGRTAEGVAELRRAIQLDPLSSRAWNLLANALIAADDYAGAQKAAQRALEIAPDGAYVVWGFGLLQLLQHRPADALATFGKLEPGAYLLLGTAMAEHDLGHGEAAQSALREMTSKYAENAAYQIADAFAWLGDKDRAFEWLERAFDQHDTGMSAMKVDPLLKNLRGDARYLALLRKMNLAD